MFVSCKRGNSSSTRIALASRESWYNVTCSENNSWVHKAKCVLIHQRQETNAAQSTCVPCVTLYALVPPNKKKFYSLRFVYVRHADNVNVVYAKDFGVTVVASVVAIIAIIFQ